MSVLFPILFYVTLVLILASGLMWLSQFGLFGIFALGGILIVCLSRRNK